MTSTQFDPGIVKSQIKDTKFYKITILVLKNLQEAFYSKTQDIWSDLALSDLAGGE